MNPNFFGLHVCVSIYNVHQSCLQSLSRCGQCVNCAFRAGAPGPMRRSDSCLLLLHGSKLLAELNWHNNTSARPTPAMPAVLPRTIMTGWRTHLHGYFLSLVIVAALHESKGKHSIQISEGMKSRLRQQGKTGTSRASTLSFSLTWKVRQSRSSCERFTVK